MGPSLPQRALAAALRPLSKVRPEEALVASVMTLAAFPLLMAYYLLKTVRDAGQPFYTEQSTRR